MTDQPPERRTSDTVVFSGSITDLLAEAEAAKATVVALDGVRKVFAGGKEGRDVEAL